MDINAENKSTKESEKRLDVGNNDDMENEEDFNNESNEDEGSEKKNSSSVDKDRSCDNMISGKCRNEFVFGDEKLYQCTGCRGHFCVHCMKYYSIQYIPTCLECHNKFSSSSKADNSSRLDTNAKQNTSVENENERKMEQKVPSAEGKNEKANSKRKIDRKRSNKKRKTKNFWQTAKKYMLGEESSESEHSVRTDEKDKTNRQIEINTEDDNLSQNNNEPPDDNENVGMSSPIGENDDQSNNDASLEDGEIIETKNNDDNLNHGANGKPDDLENIQIETNNEDDNLSQNSIELSNDYENLGSSSPVGDHALLENRQMQTGSEVDTITQNANMQSNNLSSRKKRKRCDLLRDGLSQNEVIDLNNTEGSERTQRLAKRQTPKLITQEESDTKNEKKLQRQIKKQNHEKSIKFRNMLEQELRKYPQSTPDEREKKKNEIFQQMINAECGFEDPHDKEVWSDEQKQWEEDAINHLGGLEIQQRLEHDHNYSRQITHAKMMRVCRLPEDEQIKYDCKVFFKVTVLDTNGNATIRETVSYMWMRQNFPTLTVRMRSNNIYGWIAIPAGKREPNENDLLVAPKKITVNWLETRFIQREEPSCMKNAMASALYYLCEKKEAGKLLRLKLNGYQLPEQIDLLCDYMNDRILSGKLPYLGTAVKQGKVKRGGARKQNKVKYVKLPASKLLERTPLKFPTLVIPILEDGSAAHAAVAIDDLLFDSSQNHPIKLNQEGLDWLFEYKKGTQFFKRQVSFHFNPRKRRTVPARHFM